MELPACCGLEMKPNLVLGRFIEAKCNKCQDVVYIKQYSKAVPQLIDD